MELRHPFIITARLLPGVKINDAFVSIEYADKVDDDGRTVYQYHIDLPNGQSHSNDDLSGHGNLKDGMGDLLSFLGACAESRQYHGEEPGENAELFPDFIGEWANHNSDEISMVQCEVEETENCLIE